jgi:hypothetical protein
VAVVCGEQPGAHDRRRHDHDRHDRDAAAAVKAFEHCDIVPSALAPMLAGRVFGEWG